jgi:hypothetical protein
MNRDVAKVAPSARMGGTVFSGFASTDMFIQALEAAAKNGKSAITPGERPEDRGHADLAAQGSHSSGRVPRRDERTGAVLHELFESDGTTWNTVEP